MVFASFRRLVRRASTTRAANRRPVRPKFRPVFENLEDRFLPSTVSWIGGSGDWNTAANWSGGAVPGSADDVVINNAGSSAISVTHSSGTHTVNSLSLSSGSLVNFTLSGGTLTVSTTVQDNGPFNLTGGTLAGATVAAGTTVRGSGNFSGVTLAGTLDEATAGGTVYVTNGLTLNNGTVNLGSPTGSNGGGLSFQVASQTLAGTGTVTFGGYFYGNNLSIASGLTLTIASGITVHGAAGEVGSGGGTFVNQGTISEDVSGGAGIALLGAGWTNTGTLQAPNGGTLYLDGSFTPAGLGNISSAASGTIGIGGTLTNTGNTLALSSVAGPLTVLGGATITGGTVAGQATNTLTLNGGTLAGVTVPAGSTLKMGGSYSTLSGVTLAGTLDEASASGSVNVTNGLTLSNGTVNLGSASGSTWAYLNFQGGNQTLGGTGTVTFGGYVYGNLLGVASGMTLTIASGITVHGASGYVGGGSGTLINQGTIAADASGSGIGLTATSWTNAGTLQSVNGGWLSLGGSFTTAGIGSLSSSANSTVALAGALNNAGATLSLPNVLGTLYLSSNATITGGTVAGQATNTLTLNGGTLAGVTVAGTLDGSTASSSANVTNGLTLNNGTINLGNASGNTFGRLNFQTASQTLGGNGTVVLGGSNGNLLYIPSGLTLTIATGITIRGCNGTIGVGGGTFVNQGTIAADVASGQILLSATGWTNAGVIRALNGDTVYGQGTSTNFASGTLTGGTWQVSANSTLRLLNTAITTNAATILLDGANSNFYGDANSTNALADLAANASAGSLTIQNGRSLSVPGAFSNAGSVTVGSSSTLTAAGNYSQSAGTTTLNGGTLTASTTVSIGGGTLTGAGTVNANVSNAGQVSPGLNLGTLSINGTYTQTTTGTLNVELGGLTAGSQYDQVAVSGTATLGGTLNVSVVNSLVIVPGNSFRILTFSSASGDFTAKNGLDTGTGAHLVPVYDPGDLTLLTKGDTTTSLSSSANPSPFGQLVTFTATVNSVPSGGAAPTGTVTFTVDGVAQAPVALSGSQATFSSSTLGVGTHTVSAAYSGEANYFASTSTTLTQTITKVATTTTVSASMTPSVYGQSVTFTATVAGTVGSGTPSGTVTFSVDGIAQAPVTLAGGQAAFALNSLGAGSHSITAAYGGDSNYGNSSSSTFTEAVTPAPLTVTATHQAKVYGSADPALTYTASGFQLADTAASVLTGALTRAVGESVGSYAIGQGTLATTSNYTLSFAGNTLAITPAPLTVTASAQAKVYGGADPALTYAASGFQFSDTAAGVLTGALTRAAGESVGSYAITQGTLAATSNYSIRFTGNTLAITPAPLTVTANAQTKVYGSTDPALTYVASGFQFSDSAATVLTGALSRTAGESVAGGPYAIGQGTLAANGNYTLGFTGSALTITPAPLSVTANHQTKVYGSADPTLTYAASGFQFSDTAAIVLTGALTRAAGESVAGGPYAIGQGTLVANSNYTLTFTGNTLAITPAPLTLTANAQTKVYGSADPALTYTASGFQLADTAASVLTGALTRVVGESVGSYAITQGTLAADSNYTLSFAGNTLAITPAPLSVTASAQTKVYGAADPALTYVASGLQFTDTAAGVLTGALTRAAGESVGSYAITQGTLAATSNYSIRFTGNTLNITPAPLTVTANAQTKVYGSTDPALTYVASGFQFSDTAATVLTGALSRTAGESVAGGPYAITQGTLAANGNYTLSFTGSTLTVTPAPLTVTADAQTKVYGAADPALTYAASGFQFSDTAATVLTGALSRTAGESVAGGPYAIGQGTLAANSNYILSFTGSALTITPAPLSVTANHQTKVYGSADPTLTYAASGFQFSDTAATVLTGALTRAAGESVAGSPYAIGQGTLAANSNYTVTFTGNTLAITPAALTVTANAQTKVYGSADPALTYTVSGLQFTDTAAGVLTGALTRAAGESVGSYAIGRGTLAANSNYTLGFTGNSLAITTAPLTVTANAQSKVYGSADPALTYVASGFQFSDTAAGVLTGALSRTAGETVTGGPYAIGQGTLAANSNYTLSFTGNTLTITPASLTVTANHQTKVYGSADPALTYVASGFQLSDTAATVLTGALSRAAGETVAGGPYAITQGTLAANSNYTVSFTGNSLTITPATLTITANNQTKVYGAALPALTVTYGGFVSGDTAASLTTAPTVNTTATAASHVAGSPYAITASGAVDSNYNISYVGGSLTITPAPLTITANNQTKVYGAPLPTFTANYSGFVLGDTPNVLSGTLTFSTTATASSPVGTYAVTPGGQTSTDYAITYMNGTLTISPANTTTALNSSANPSLAGQAVTFTAAVAATAPGAGMPTGTVTFTIDGTAQPAATLSGGQAILTTSSLAPGSHTVSAFYSGDGNFNTSSSASLTQTVNGSSASITALSPASVTEGSPAFTLTVTGTNFATGFTVQWNGSPLTTTFVSATQLRANVPAGNLADEGTARVTVVSPGGTASNALTFTVTDAVPAVGAITAPTAPVAVNTSVTVRASFTDAGTLDTHTAVWNWGDGTTAAGTVTEHNGSGSVSGRHTYTTAGLFTVTLTVTDNAGRAGQATFSYVVVFDKAAGTLAGAGSITSGAGDYTADPKLTGTLDFALGAGFLDGRNTPVGLTELWLSAANLHFQSTGYDWLVINGGHALYQGSGTVNGTGNFGFVVAAVDGQFNGGSGPDAIRVRLWDKAHGNAVVYDTQPGAPIPAAPTTTLDSGAIMILPAGGTGPGAPTGGRNTFPRAAALGFAEAPAVPPGGDLLTASWPGTSPAPAAPGETRGNAGAPQDVLFADSLEGLFSEMLREEETISELLQSLSWSAGGEK